jgi:hypothetical protein
MGAIEDSFMFLNFSVSSEPTRYLLFYALTSLLQIYELPILQRTSLSTTPENATPWRERKCTPYVWQLGQFR